MLNNVTQREWRLFELITQKAKLPRHTAWAIIRNKRLVKGERVT